MRDLRWIPPDSPELLSKERLRCLASRQFGVVARRQLLHLAIASASIGDWTGRGDLHRIHRGVYAVGHTALCTEAWLTAAVLYAGPGAMLSHDTAAWWMGLSDRRRPVVHVSTPRQRADVPGIAVHRRRDLTRAWHRDLPVTPVPQLLLDYAATHDHGDIRYALAQAEYHGWLTTDALEPHLGHGRPGAAALRRALEHHQPQLAFTRSRFERRMLFLCERHGIPVPEFNVRLNGYLVDAVWRRQKVIVEADGKDGHSHWGQIQSDHERDLAHRLAGFVVLRYTWRQLTRTGRAVARDIRHALAAAR